MKKFELTKQMKKEIKEIFRFTIKVMVLAIVALIAEYLTKQVMGMTTTNVVIDEIIKPGMSSFIELSDDEIKLEVYDIVRCSSGGVGLDLALYLLNNHVNWTDVYVEVENFNNNKNK